MRRRPVFIPSPAIAIVGRHNSGKTTLIEKVIAELTQRGVDVGSIKHHTHAEFEIDYPGKDSFRHRAAGATETVIASPIKLARVRTLDHEVECAEIVRSMPGHDIIIVEGYRKSGLPTIEIMRSGNERDRAVAAAFATAAAENMPLSEDFVQESFGEAYVQDAAALGTAAGVAPDVLHGSVCDKASPKVSDDLRDKMPAANTVGIVTDIPEAMEAAASYGIPVFPLDDIEPLVSFLEHSYVRQHISVVIQAGGESRRMGQSKATVPFCGRPLICNVIERLAPAADEIIITTNEADNLAFLFEMYPELQIRLVPDRHDFRGALPGLHTALEAARCPFVAVVACDMVFASAALVVAESIDMAVSGADIVVPVNKHGFEPFHSTYRKDACLPAVIRAIEAGKSRVQDVFNDPEVRVAYFPQDRVLQVEPHGGCFINANTPDELHRIEESYLAED